MKTYEVPEQNMGWLREKVEKLNKRAEKLSVPPITIRVVSERLIDRPDLHARDSVERSLLAIEGNTGRMITFRLFKIEVDGEAPVLAGWKFVATLQHVQDNGDSATVIHAVPGETVPTKYRDTDGRWCDHCQTRRQRNDTFIVEKVEGRDSLIPNTAIDPENDGPAPEAPLGTTKQVGRQCLRDFLGHPKPEMYADWATQLGLLDDLFRSAETDYEGGTRQDRVFRTTEYLTVVNAAIRKYGWVSGRMAHEAEERGETPLPRTRDVATSYILDDPTLGMTLEPNENDLARARLVVAWGEEKLPALVAAKPDNDYLYNLSQVLKLDALDHRMLGIAASAINAYDREMNKNRSYEERAAKSKYVGTEGERSQFLVDVTAVRSITYQDGNAGTVVEFVDPDGNELVWFTSGRGDFVPGKTYRIKATVKRHSEFRGIKQTALGRVNVVETIQ